MEVHTRKISKVAGPCRAHRIGPWCLNLRTLALLGFIVLLAPRAALAQAPQPNTPDYSANPKWFPQIISAYKPRRLPPPDLSNSKTLSDMIRDGKIELSLAQLAAAVVENNLNLALDRSFNYSAQADLLRARGGQAARGVDAVGAIIPNALFSAAIGAGVGGGGGAFGGVSGVGSISGATRSLSFQPRGSFDPQFTFDFSWDRTTSPLNTVVVAGSPVVSTHSTFFSFGYQQAFPTGTSFSVDLATQRH